MANWQLLARNEAQQRMGKYLYRDQLDLQLIQTPLCASRSM